MPEQNDSKSASNTSPEDAPAILLESEQIGQGSQLRSGVVTPKNLLFFGAYILLVLVGLMIAASWTYMWSDKDHLQPGKEIFEFAKLTLPPIATLILGFYFRGSRNSD